MAMHASLAMSASAESQGALPPPGPANIVPKRESVLDSQHALMSTAMLDAKRARMKVENDRQLLANRIARLQMEELRATKRIEQTHRRTQEILTVKNRHHEQQKDKDNVKREHEEIVSQHRAALTQIKQERKEALQASKEANALQRQEQVRANRGVQARHAEMIAHARAAELNSAMYKRNEVRRVEALARERKLREKEMMIAHLQQRGQEKQVDEIRRAEQYEQDLQELERQEYELIVALEGHKEARQKVYIDLEEELFRPSKKKGVASSASEPGVGSSASAPLS